MDASRDEDPPRRPSPPAASSSVSNATNHVGLKKSSKTKSSSSFRSLGRMLQYLHDQEVTVELKNGIRYRGMLDSDMCDDYFNVTLRNVRVDVPYHQQRKKSKQNHRRLGSSHHQRQPREQLDTAEPSSFSLSSSQQQHHHHPLPPTAHNSSPSLLLSVLQVRGSQIRYILLGDLDLNRLVASGVERERRARSAHQRTSLQPKKPGR